MTKQSIISCTLSASNPEFTQTLKPTREQMFTPQIGEYLQKLNDRAKLSQRFCQGTVWCTLAAEKKPLEQRWNRVCEEALQCTARSLLTHETQHFRPEWLPVWSLPNRPKANQHPEVHDKMRDGRRGHKDKQLVVSGPISLITNAGWYKKHLCGLSGHSSQSLTRVGKEHHVLT